MQEPTQVFSFTDHSTAHPTVPHPGDRLDAQFADHAAAITSTQDAVKDVRRSDGALKNAVVTLDSMHPDTVEALVAEIRDQVATDAERAETAAAESEIHAASANTHKLAAQASAAQIATALNEINAGKGSALDAISQAEAEAIAQQANLATLAADAQNAANDAEFDKNLASAYADVSLHWAEYMPGPIPPNILAVMGITGEHWSSRWWANQSDLHANRAEDAALAVVTLGSYYLGAFASPPTVEPVFGGPLTQGAAYFDTTLNVLRVWTGTVWQTVTLAYTEGATPLQTNILIDTSWWVFNGSTVTFLLRDFGAVPVTPGYASGCIVSLDGVIQDPASYSIASDTITFDTAPVAGTTAWMIAGTTFSIAAVGDMEKDTYDTDNDGKVDVAETADSAPWAGITGKPATFPPSAHTHAISDVTGLQAALDAAASAAHTHPISDIVGLQTALDGKAATSHTHTLSQITDLSDLVIDCGEV